MAKEADIRWPRAAAYVRESTEEQGQGFSPDAQREAIHRFAEENGLGLVAEYSDFHSGWKKAVATSARPAATATAAISRRPMPSRWRNRSSTGCTASSPMPSCGTSSSRRCGTRRRRQTAAPPGGATSTANSRRTNTPCGASPLRRSSSGSARRSTPLLDRAEDEGKIVAVKPGEPFLRYSKAAEDLAGAEADFNSNS